MYKTGSEEPYTLLRVSGTTFIRGMSQIAARMSNIKTIIFPKTVKKVLDDVFWSTKIRSVILNEGLEWLGKFQDDCYDYQENIVMDCYGVFGGTQLRKVKLPSTL